MPVPLTMQKPSESQRVREKSKSDDLFQAICRYYDPFHTRFTPFPLPVVAQARIWRGHGLPNEETLAQSLRGLTEKGFAEGQVESLIAYCESAIRPIKAAELEIEKLLPNMLFTRSETFVPTSAGHVLLETAFFNQLKVFEKKVGRGWVLAAGSVPLSIHGRPPLIAPWVVGVTMKRWLTIKKVSDKDSEALALDLTSVLLERSVRLEELRHWESLFNQVEVTQENGSKALLPGYLVDIGSRMRPHETGLGVDAGTDWTPTRYVQSLPLDNTITSALAKTIQMGWRRQKKTKTSHTVRRHSTIMLDASVEPESEARAICKLCVHLIALQSVYDHFRDMHGISRNEIEADAVRQELRRTRSKEVLLRYNGP